MKLLSTRSIYNFVKTNSFLILTGTIEFFTHFIHPIYMIYPTTLIRNEVFLYTIDYLVKDHNYIHSEKRILPKEHFPFEFQLFVIANTSIEALTSYLIYQIWYSGSNYIVWKSSDLLYLIPISFLFEIIFDFFHYWTHRIIHQIPFLYKKIHKIHHTFSYPNVFIAYYQHPLDLVLTNLIPTLLSIWILQDIFSIQISYYLWSIINSYKTYIEICGHSGKNIPNTSGFPQCMWLVKMLKIELYTKDHDHHHSLNNCNYSKRFSLWDKIFGTFRNEKETKEE